jgi:hypothetical protein
MCGGILYLLLKLAVSPCLFVFGLYMYCVVYDLGVQTYCNELMTYRNLDVLVHQWCMVYGGGVRCIV